MNFLQWWHAGSTTTNGGLDIKDLEKRYANLEKWGLTKEASDDTD